MSRVNPNPPMSLDDLKRPVAYWETLEQEGYQASLKLIEDLAIYPNKVKEISQFANDEEVKNLKKLLKNLETDIKNHVNELNEIRKLHLDEKGNPKKGPILDKGDLGDSFALLEISSRYMSWGERLQALTIQPVVDISTICDEIINRNNQNKETQEKVNES